LEVLSLFEPDFLFQLV